MQSHPLKVLILEDSPEDLELLVEQLSEAGFEMKVTHTDNKEGFLEALQKKRYDIILSDFRLPGFDAFEALAISKGRCPDIPFICVSGSIGEELAIDLLKRGAVDYVLKDRPARLPFAIRHALEEAKRKAKGRRAARELKQSESRFRQVVENAQEWIWEVDADWLYTYASPAVESLLGYAPDEVVGKKYFHDFFLPENADALKEVFRKAFTEAQPFRHLEYSIVHRDGSQLTVLTSGSPILSNKGNLKGYRGVTEDMTERKKTEELLRLSELKFRKIFADHAAVKLIMDPESGDIVEANQAAAEFYGWPVEVLRTMRIGQINALPPDELKRKIRETKKLKTVHYEFQHRKADGSLVDVEVFSSRIEIGDREYLHSIIHDVSEKKKVEEERRLLKRAVEASSVAVVIYDAEGNINYVNPYFSKLTGYSLEDVIGENPRFLNLGNQPKSFYDELWKTILSGKDWVGELQNRKKNGEIYWENAVISPIQDKDGKVANFVAIKEDITEKKRIFEELIEAKEKAEKSDKLKTAFINNISHEIRTPLNGILGFGQLLAGDDFPPEERGEMLDNLQVSTDRLLTTMTDYMDMAMIVSDTMKVHRKEFPLASLFEEIAEKAEKACSKKRIPFRAETPPDSIDRKLESDPVLIQKILDKLLDNAVKFTNEGSVTCGYNFDTDRVHFYVKDTGCGIESDKLDLIFGMFSQSDTAMTRGYEGSGLGLTIAKGLVTLLDGEIHAVSEKGTGSEFYFTVPMRNSRNQYSSNKPATPTEKRNGKPLILIAEDDDIAFMYMRKLLNPTGSEILHAANGIDAVDFCRQSPGISCVFMDIKMPLMDGLEATREIRHFRPELPIIATTAYAQTGDEAYFLENGCTDYITKPVGKEKLLAVVKKYSECRF